MALKAPCQLRFEDEVAVDVVPGTARDGGAVEEYRQNLRGFGMIDSCYSGDLHLAIFFLLVEDSDEVWIDIILALLEIDRLAKESEIDTCDT